MACFSKATLSAVVVGTLLCAHTAAAPAAMKRQTGITALTPSQITAFRPYTHFASTGYCSPASTLAWNCGANCEANPSFKPVASGGDGALTQFWYVGYDPSLNEVIVGHQGTDSSKILPSLTDGDFALGWLDGNLFPGVGSSVLVHNGFAASQSRSAPQVLAAVQNATSKFGTKKVTVTGHSLGAALALLDAVYLPLHIPGITTRFVGYGLPRVGNQAFADYVDAQPISVTHINNKKDIVPILPPRSFGFHHPSGEVHIDESGAWEACPGQDNPDSECIVGAVPNLFVGDGSDHVGPYDGITMGC
ncbi:lipase [Ganoderma leucocontextum]|nr:lipase [Ganoderma leucocontextum]